jgi:hypothetical protein
LLLLAFGVFVASAHDAQATKKKPTVAQQKATCWKNWDFCDSLCSIEIEGQQLNIGEYQNCEKGCRAEWRSALMP